MFKLKVCGLQCSFAAWPTVTGEGVAGGENATVTHPEKSSCFLSSKILRLP